MMPEFLVSVRYHLRFLFWRAALATKPLADVGG